MQSAVGCRCQGLSVAHHRTRSSCCPVGESALPQLLQHVIGTESWATLNCFDRSSWTLISESWKAGIVCSAYNPRVIGVGGYFYQTRAQSSAQDSSQKVRLSLELGRDAEFVERYRSLVHMGGIVKAISFLRVLFLIAQIQPQASISTVFRFVKP